MLERRKDVEVFIQFGAWLLSLVAAWAAIREVIVRSRVLLAAL